MTQRRTIVQLGRIGDILNILPPLYEATRNGRQIRMVVSAEYAPVLDGVSYVEPVLFRGDYSDLEGGVRLADTFGDPVVVSQIYGRNLKHDRISESYMRDAWEKAGVGQRWEQLPFVLDRRSPEREQQLAARVDWSRPVVLFNMFGRSSPFPNSEWAMREVRRQLPEVNFVDLESFRADRIFDLLALYDRAHALITVDTATMHLAQASAVPVIALVNPNPWYGSLRRPNHLLRRTYKEVDPDEIADAVRRTMTLGGKIVHLAPEWNMSPEDRARNLVAAASWKREYARGWSQIEVLNEKLPRNSRDALGDVRPVPFVKDVLELGIRNTTHDHDIVVLTNSDAGFSEGLTDRMRRLVLAKGAAYSYRFDHPKISAPLGYLETVSGGCCGGLDFFAFTRGWLERHWPKIPDMVFGRTMWDLVFRDLIKGTDGGELYGAVWHEDHDSFWKQSPTSAGNLHNVRIADQWRASHDTGRPYRFAT